MSKNSTSESLALSGCLQYLEVRGIYHWRNNTDAVKVRPEQFMRFGKVGSSDIQRRICRCLEEIIPHRMVGLNKQYRWKKRRSENS